MERMMSVREYAVAKGLSLCWVYQMIWAGRLHAQKVGRVWKISVPASVVKEKAEDKG